MAYKILFSNIGYAKGIDGSLSQHLRYFGRHFYSNVAVQNKVLSQLKSIIQAENPDVCCFVEIDSGSLHSANYNQIEALIDANYAYHDVAGKYGKESRLNKFFLHQGKSNAFVSKTKLTFKHLYFQTGNKRLIYHIDLPDGRELLFAHFSLERKVRVKQMQEIKAFAAACKGELIIMADFNIMTGFTELKPLLEEENLVVLNREDEPTFTFHTRRLALDLCIVSKSLAPRTQLKIIHQPFSDHAALILEI